MTYKELCAELTEALTTHAKPSDGAVGYVAGLLTRARAALAEPEPEGPTRRQLMMLADDMGMASVGDAAEYGRAVLAHWGNHPALQPISVSERLQQVEDLAADAIGALRYIEQVHGRLYGVGWDRVYEKVDRLLPAHALPVPSHD